MCGNKNTHCQFVYLETPHIDGDAGRLRIRARFSGRSALDSAVAARSICSIAASVWAIHSI